MKMKIRPLIGSILFVSILSVSSLAMGQTAAVSGKAILCNQVSQWINTDLKGRILIQGLLDDIQKKAQGIIVNVYLPNEPRSDNMRDIRLYVLIDQNHVIHHSICN